MLGKDNGGAALCLAGDARQRGERFVGGYAAMQRPDLWAAPIMSWRRPAMARREARLPGISAGASIFVRCAPCGQNEKGPCGGPLPWMQLLRAIRTGCASPA